MCIILIMFMHVYRGWYTQRTLWQLTDFQVKEWNIHDTAKTNPIICTTQDLCVVLVKWSGLTVKDEITKPRWLKYAQFNVLCLHCVLVFYATNTHAQWLGALKEACLVKTLELWCFLKECIIIIIIWVARQLRTDYRGYVITPMLLVILTMII